MVTREKNEILLESGTNELEIVMFSIGEETYGINVLKVREIIQPLPVTKTPNAHPHVEGIIRLRNEIMPVVDTAKVLGYTHERAGTDKYIICELNQMKVAFHVESVSRIHRISWQQIEEPEQLIQGTHSHTIGVIKREEGMTLLLDYEKMISDINPKAGIQPDTIVRGLRPERASKRVLVAEDSPILQQLIFDTLERAGYEQIAKSTNGEDAWTQLAEGEKIPDIVITDIEMPKMDGHHLTKKIKELAKTKDIPVILFSSLITDDLYHKGVKVGADEQVSKPEIQNLIQKMDNLLF